MFSTGGADIGRKSRGKGVRAIPEQETLVKKGPGRLTARLLYFVDHADPGVGLTEGFALDGQSKGLELTPHVSRSLKASFSVGRA